MLPGVYPHWTMNTPSVFPKWLGVYRDEIVEGERIVSGNIVDPWGRLIPEGKVIFKRLSRAAGNVFPLEHEAAVVNGYFSITLVADVSYDILVLDQFGETIWNFIAPLEYDEADLEITLAELYIASGKTPY